MKFPEVGEVHTLNHEDSTQQRDVEIIGRLGFAQIRVVKDPKTQEEGVIAFQADGSWWWVRKIEDREAWQESPNSWKNG